MKTPTVSILMAARDSGRHIRAAVESILNQSRTDWELIIVDGGSSDSTPEIVRHFRDERVRLFQAPRRLYPAAARNLGLRRARGQHIAIMDSDDVSQPNRLAVQVEYLRRHPNIGIVGSAEEVIDGKGSLLGANRFPTEPIINGWKTLLGGWCLSHSSTVIRRPLMEGLRGYAGSLRCGEDYELWSRAIFRTRIANLPNVLVQRRLSGRNWSFRHPRLERTVVLDAMRSAITRLTGSRIPFRATQNLFWLERKLSFHEDAANTAAARKMRRHTVLLERGTAPKTARETRTAALWIQRIGRAYLRRRFGIRERKLLEMDVLRRLHLLQSVSRP